MITRIQGLELLRIASNGAAVDFRDGQWEAINAIVNNRKRTLLVQRTGWGKSMVYFLATKVLREQGSGPTLIISPLLALMRNQLEAARRLGLVAETINSANRRNWDAIAAQVLNNTVDVLLVAPERLSNEEFVENCLLPIAGNIALLVIDEAHCISDWGHDFRPDYQRINRILQKLPKNVAVLATTATANDRVVRDIKTQLGPQTEVSRGLLSRNTLKLQNIMLPNQATRLAWLADVLPHLSGSGIIYTLTIRDAERVAAWLQKTGIDAQAYHGRVDGEFDEGGDRREELEGMLLRNEVKALVATSALGMGFDKPDLGFVVHFQVPQSVVHYYQQVGRAGRAIDNAYGILLGGEEDDEINQYFITQAFPPKNHVRAIIEALENSEDGLSVPMLMQEVNLRKGQIEKVLKLLSVVEASPVAQSDNLWVRTANPFSIDSQRIQRLTKNRQAEWQTMQDYMTSENCLMEFLSKSLDDPNAGSCGRCAVCVGKPLLPTIPNDRTIRKAIAFIKRSEVPFEPRKRWESQAFSAYNSWRGNIPLSLRVEQGRALSLWGDVGWARLVKENSEAGHFSDELVQACAEMVRSRWLPDPYPGWVTCVPSLRNPSLVRNFAQRLATSLEIPFVDVVSKVLETERQRSMMNGWQQAHNLDGAFAVNRDNVLDSAVLLVDDVVDSRWSMTIIGALLRQAGTGRVFPLALSLASASSG